MENRAVLFRVVIALVIVVLLYGQINPIFGQTVVTITWERTFGGAKDDCANSIEQTSDGGYIVAGYTESFGAGGSDVYILKLDREGKLQWQKTYGGIKDDYAYSIQQTSDGGYIVAGETLSFGAGFSDVYILKLDKDGNLQWEKTFGGEDYDTAYSVQQTSDGGYIVAGQTMSFGQGFSGVYVLKLDKDGNLRWEKTFGGEDYDTAYSVQQINDGGYIVVGGRFSYAEGGDVYILEINKEGNLQWQNTFGGITNDRGYSVQQTNDGGYIVAGCSGLVGVVIKDVYILKLGKSQ